MSKQKKKGDIKIEKRKNEILGIMITAFSIFFFLTIYFGYNSMLGDRIVEIFRLIMGEGIYILPIMLFLWGILLIRNKTLKFNLKIFGFLLLFLTIISFIHIYNHSQIINGYIFLRDGGGVIGGAITWVLIKGLGLIGSYIILSALLLIGFLLWTDILLHAFFRNLKLKIIEKYEKSKKAVIDFSEKIFSNTQKEASYQNANPSKPTTQIKNNKSTTKSKKRSKKKKSKKSKKKKTKAKEDESLQEFEIKDKTAKASNNKSLDGFKLPKLNLLTHSDKNKITLENKSELLEETLASFGVEAEVKEVSHGPTITRYEVQPATGVKVSKIVNLSDDISLALAAPDVRIEAPIPGKSAVGIEVPHQNNLIVRLGDILSTDKFQSAESKLTLALGRGIEGDPIVTDLAKMPHLLIAGATGSGKSVCMGSIITSLLYKASPKEVKLILIDPKKVELINFEGLPHLFSPVVTDPQKASNVLKYVVQEMDRRYELFSDTRTNSIETYNSKVEKEEDKLPYIVVIIDELSDLMMVAANEVEDNICRLAQMSRAAGIHLVVATQRPSVDVITGLIKANIPSRISFAVSSQTDSRTILDMGGAEKLLGNGDMLFYPVDYKKPVRIQGALITNDEIVDIVEFLKVQKEEDERDFEVDLDELSEVEINKLGEEKDDLYEKAVQLVVQYRASISMLQRRLHIGHSRAARLIDMMEEEGIVGPYAGSKPRKVLIDEEDLEEYLNDN
ncbi:MAG TPA: DNA translocase FtsK 4TM domain-containing protein [Halanaerobiales bacterium]|nr:DNA translocase FtsK 4TM domain-containing protein [Halanaerobiales bacterium]